MCIRDSLQADYIVHKDDSNTKFGFPENDKFKVRTNNVDRFNIIADGKVGIGTDSPTSQLEVSSSQGSVFIDFNTSTGKGVSLAPDQGTGGWARQFGFTSQSLNSSDFFGGFGGYGGNSGSFIRWFIGRAYNNNAMSIVSSSGNVGIGTLTPTRKLQVVQTTANLSLIHI